MASDHGARPQTKGAERPASSGLELFRSPSQRSAHSCGSNTPRRELASHHRGQRATAPDRRPELPQPPDDGHRQIPLPGGDAGQPGREQLRDRDRGGSAGAEPGRGPRRPDGGDRLEPDLDAAQHRRLRHRRGGDPGGQARPRAGETRRPGGQHLCEAGGDPGQPPPAAGSDRHPAGGRATGEGGLHSAALHQCRPPSSPPPGGGRLRHGDAAGFSDRLGPGDPQRRQHRLDHRELAGAGGGGRRHRRAQRGRPSHGDGGRCPVDQ